MGPAEMLSRTMGQILLETTLRHVENKEVIADSQPGFPKGRLFLSHLVTKSFGSYDEGIHNKLHRTTPGLPESKAHLHRDI